MLTLSGCAREQLETYYGRHRWSGEAGSVNGTDALAAMFEAAGHDVQFRRSLVTSDMQAADVVVWVPNDHSAPDDEVLDWFDFWLSDVPGRVLVFVGRDYSAAPQYMQFLLEQRGGFTDEPAKQRQPDGRQQPPAAEDDPAGEDDADDNEHSENDDDAQRHALWFSYVDGDTREVRSLEGPWAKGIDAAATEIQLGTRLVPNGEVETLLTSPEGLLVSRLEQPWWGGSQVILVANGSFVLNLPLVNKEHRQLAARVVEASGAPGEVVFLESGPGGPPIDPPPVDTSFWTLFTAWPLGIILLQLAAVGVIFAFARWPIFGRPQQPPPEITADFAKHVGAVGRLLARTDDGALALEGERPDQPVARPPQTDSRRSALRRPPSLPPT